MRFDVNAPKPHYLTPESEKAHSTWEVCSYLERCWWIAYSKPKAAVCDDSVAQCERVHRIMRRERPNNALGWWCPSALSCSVFLNRTRHKCGNPTLGVKANRSVAAAKGWIESGVQCGVTAHLAIWKGYYIKGDAQNDADIVAMCTPKTGVLNLTPVCVNRGPHPQLLTLPPWSVNITPKSVKITPTGVKITLLDVELTPEI